MKITTFVHAIIQKLTVIPNWDKSKLFVAF